MRRIPGLAEELGDRLCRKVKNVKSKM